MKPDQFIREVKSLYIQAREPRFIGSRVERGRSRSISSDLEDLMAAYLEKQDCQNDRTFFVDQPINLDGRIRYPDIMIQNSNGVIENLIDMKTDMGWARGKLIELAEEWNKRIGSIRSQDAVKFKRGRDKTVVPGTFSKRLKYHIVVLSMKNGGKVTEKHFDIIKNGAFPNVEIYKLSLGEHPNTYAESDKIKKTSANFDDFDALQRNLFQN